MSVCSLVSSAISPQSVVKPNAYEMTIEEMVAKCSGDISEIHISGGMPPEWKLENYVQIVRALRQAYPNVGIKAFTAVDVEWAARISKQSIKSVLMQLKEAGLTALPGGGAEVFSERVRQELFPLRSEPRNCWKSIGPRTRSAFRRMRHFFTVTSKRLKSAGSIWK